jgi:hypothetical protein
VCGCWGTSCVPLLYDKLQTRTNGYCVLELKFLTAVTLLGVVMQCSWDGTCPPGILDLPKAIT